MIANSENADVQQIDFPPDIAWGKILKWMWSDVYSVEPRCVNPKLFILKANRRRERRREKRRERRKKTGMVIGSSASS
jgi:hypothetical protein